MFECEQCGAAARSHPDLGVEILQMIVGGLRRDAERARDLLDRLAGGDEPQHLDLARRQAGDPGMTNRRHAMPRSRQHGLCRLGIQRACAHCVLDRT